VFRAIARILRHQAGNRPQCGLRERADRLVGALGIANSGARDVDAAARLLSDLLDRRRKLVGRRNADLDASRPHRAEAIEAEAMRAPVPSRVKANPLAPLELMSLTVMRRGDVIRACRAWITNNETTWDYVQAKDSGNKKRNRMIVEIYPPLLDIIKATPGAWDRVGVDPTVPFLRNRDGKLMTNRAFDRWFGKACDDAGLPECTPQGRRLPARLRGVRHPRDRGDHRAP